MSVKLPLPRLYVSEPKYAITAGKWCDDHDVTALEAEHAQLRAENDALSHALAAANEDACEARRENEVVREVVEAARRWRSLEDCPEPSCGSRTCELVRAVDRLDAARGEPCGTCGGFGTIPGATGPGDGEVICPDCHGTRKRGER